MSHPYCGAAFGLAFVSNQPLPEFQDCGADPPARDDVTIEWHPPRAQRVVTKPKPFRMAGDVFDLSIPDVCDFQVTQARIDIFPAPGVEPASTRAYLVGSAIGALLHIRSVLVFHGSAVCLPDGTAAVFCGMSTAGKSTLAAFLASCGYGVLADDLCAIDLATMGQPMCLPGLARTKLWRDAVQRLGLEHQVGPETRVLPDMDKHCLPVATARRPALLSHFYELQVDETSQGPLSVTPVQGVDKLTVMFSHVYRSGYLQAMGRQNSLLAATARMAQTVQMHRIKRPRVGDTLPAIVDWLQSAWSAKAA